MSGTKTIEWRRDIIIECSTPSSRILNKKNSRYEHHIQVADMTSFVCSLHWVFSRDQRFAIFQAVSCASKLLSDKRLRKIHNYARRVFFLAPLFILEPLNFNVADPCTAECVCFHSVTLFSTTTFLLSFFSLCPSFRLLCLFDGIAFMGPKFLFCYIVSSISSNFCSVIEQLYFFNMAVEALPLIFWAHPMPAHWRPWRTAVPWPLCRSLGPSAGTPLLLHKQPLWEFLFRPDAHRSAILTCNQPQGGSTNINDEAEIPKSM